MEDDDTLASDALSSLEDRIHRTVELVSALRLERDAAVSDARKLRQELDDLRSQRKQARVRIEKLLGQMDMVRGA
jgi:FtsZ-binding cell division protein ZapB